MRILELTWMAMAYSRVLLPGIPWNGFGCGSSADDIRKAVDQFNATYPTPGYQRDEKKRTLNQAIPIIKLPDNFSSGDAILFAGCPSDTADQDREKVTISLIAEGFNIFNIANRHKLW